MPYDFLNNNPLLADMSPEKLQFSEPETDLLVQILKQNMSAEESAKADKIMNLMKNRRSGS